MTKFFALSIITLALAACGYKPLYEVNTLHQVSIAEVRMDKTDYAVGERRVAQFVYQDLAQSLPHSNGKYQLTVELLEEEFSLALRRDATDLRRELEIRAALFLHDQDGELIISDELFASSAYNVEDSPFGTDSGRDYARAAIGQQIAQDTLRTLARWQQQGYLNPAQ